MLTKNALPPETFEISEADIVSAAYQLKPNSSPGPRCLSDKLLLKCSHALSVPLAIMWRESFANNIVVKEQ